MEYWAWENRCAIDAATHQALEPAGVTTAVFLNRLEQLGCELKIIDPEREARALLGRPYLPGAAWRDAPDIFDCSTYLRWVFAQMGMLLPRYTWQMQTFGQAVAPLETSFLPNDILLTQGDEPFYIESREAGIGHCGLYTSRGTVLHATNGHLKQVAETKFSEFVRGGLQTVRRIIQPDDPIVTVVVPPSLEVDRSSQLICEVLRTL